MSRAAHSRTWPTLPGAPSRSAVKTVWIESTISTAGAAADDVARMVSRFVSLSSETSSAPSDIRSARNFTWSADSSPDAYSVAWPFASRRAATWRRIVDLPIPGSPPMRIIDPGTIPPPRTKSNSSIPVFQRLASDPWTSRSRGVGATLPPSASDRAPAIRRDDPPLTVTFGAMISSTSVFHSPHVSQRPCHRGYSAPHSVQR
jgi:hypothetical protein